MKKITNIFLVILLICFSFFYTDKVINMINKKDPLMKQIIENSFDYEVMPVSGILDDDTVIPGINGKKIDIDKSYENMKLSGVFREDKLIFKNLYPSNSLKDNINKYIIRGNSSKKQVSLIYILNNNYIDEVSKINEITLFINSSDLNIKNIKSLKGKEIYTYGNNGVYDDEILMNDNMIINRMTNNSSKYCLVKNKDNSTLDICNKNNMYVVLPNIMGNYYQVKNNLSNGSIILLDNLNEIEVIISYVKSKGFDIVNLSDLLSE